MSTSLEHDSYFRRCFAHRIVVLGLLHLLPQALVRELLLDTLEQAGSSDALQTEAAHHGDMVWRVRLANREGFLYLLLKFQSEGDEWMALRFLHYAAGTLLELTRGEAFSPARKLPMLLPLLIYSGSGEWRDATGLGELLEPPLAEIEDDQPHSNYRVISTRVHAANIDLEKHVNFAAALFRLQHATSAQELGRTVERLSEWLEAGDYPGLEKDLSAFAKWRLRVELGSRRFPIVYTLEEVRRLVEKEVLWLHTKEGIAQGKEQGIALGRELGKELGRKEGIALGREIGREIGKELGRKEGIALGKEQGIALGKEQGIAEGERKALRILLEGFHRGPLPEWAVARLEHATEGDLLRWFQQLQGHTGSLEELLGLPASESR